MRIKTSELEGLALDWATALATGESIGIDREFGIFVVAFGGADGVMIWNPSTNWIQGGPLIEKYRPDIGTGIQGHITALMNNSEDDEEKLIHIRGDTYLIAACRAIVAAKLGDEVEVPDDLL